jgi:transposase
MRRLQLIMKRLWNEYALITVLFWCYSLTNARKMPKSLSEDLRWRIVFLHRDGYSNKKIRSLLHISRYTVGKVLTMYRKWGCVNNPFVGPRGRRKLFDATDMEVCIVANRLNSLYWLFLKSLVEQKVDWYLNELVSEMETYWEEYLWNNEEEGDWFIVTYQVSDEQRISFINLQQNEMKCYEAFLWQRLGNILQSS